MVKKFRQNRSISHRFHDKCVFAFYAKIKDGSKKWRGNDFWEVNSRLYRYPEDKKFRTASAINVFLRFTH